MATANVNILLSLKAHLVGFEKVLAGISGLATGLAAAGAAYGLFAAKQGFDFGATLVDITERTGATVEGFQVLGNAAKESGGDFGTVERALVKMRANVEEAAQGNGKLKDSFATLGLSARALRALGVEQQFTALAEAATRSKDQSAAFGAVMNILGERNAPALLAMMKRLGSEGFEALEAQIRQTWGIMGTETAQQLDAAKERLEALQNRIVIFAGESVVELQPLLDGFATLAGWVVAVLENFEKLSTGLAYFAGQFVYGAEAMEGVAAAEALRLQQRADAAAAARRARLATAGQTPEIAEVQRLIDLQWRLADVKALAAANESATGGSELQRRQRAAGFLRAEIELQRQINQLKAQGFVVEGDNSAEAVRARMVRGLRDAQAIAGGADLRTTITAPITPEDLKLQVEYQKANDELDRMAKKLHELKVPLIEVRGELQSGISTTLRGIILQGESWNQVMVSIANSVGGRLIDSFAKLAAEELEHIAKVLFAKKTAAAAELATKVGINSASAASDAAAATPIGIGAIFKSIAQLGPIAGPLVFASAIAGMFALVSSLTKREFGGPVLAGVPYLVGERRPEIFVPDVSGRILPSVNAGAPDGGGQSSGGRPERTILVVDSLHSAREVARDPAFDSVIIRAIRNNRGELLA